MNENVIKMARLMVGCKDRTCEDCLSQSKKLFGDNKCALIEYAEVLDKAGYRPENEVVKEFAEKVNEVIEACERQDGYDAEGSHIYTIDTAILRVEMDQIISNAEQRLKENKL